MAILVLYDMQDEIKKFEVGLLPENPHIEPSPEQLAVLNVVEEDGAKTILVSNRATVSDGLTINMPSFGNLMPGDRLTITGRTGINAPTDKWGVLIHRGGGSYFLLAQHRIPAPDELYYLTYLLDTIDLEFPIRLRTDHWGNEDATMDFYIDDILITRNLKNGGSAKDSRGIVYSLMTDEYVREGLIPRPGTGAVTLSYLQTSGEPEYEMIEEGDRKSIYVRRRVHDWDGIDVHFDMMSLKQNSNYAICVEGRVDGIAPQGSQIMLQVLPGYAWRDNKDVFDNGEFVLKHTLSKAEIQNAEVIRVTTNTQGAKMSFVITGIEVKVIDEGAA